MSVVFEAVKRFCKRNYAFDYIGFAGLVAGYVVSERVLKPFHHLFRLDDPAIQYPHAEVERVSYDMLLVYSIAVPLATILVYCLLIRAKFHKIHVSLLGAAISLMLASFVTNLIKNGVGRPRPDLISRCKPAPGTPTNVLVGIEVCTETGVHTLQDGWRSFPSGHSSFAFSGLGYLTLWFAGQFHVFRPNTNLLQVFLTLGPIIGAAMIAISRLEDYRHDPVDVTSGSILGFIVAYYSYRRYFPAWRSSQCDVPYDLYLDTGRTDIESGNRPNHRDFSLAGEDSDDETPLRSG